MCELVENDKKYGIIGCDDFNSLMKDLFTNSPECPRLPIDLTILSCGHGHSRKHVYQIWRKQYFNLNNDIELFIEEDHNLYLQRITKESKYY